MINPDKDACPVCGGNLQLGTTTVSTELGFGVVVIRRVPATVCTQCGENWIADEVFAQVEEMVNEARRKQAQVEVVFFPSAPERAAV